jgi:deoxyadenosine/deoxycytidine kinase
MTKRLIIVSGNIASGKTTLAERLAATQEWLFEPESVVDNPYLSEFYQSMGSWSLHLQFHFLGHRARQHQAAANATRAVVLDRSIYEDAAVFAAALHEGGHISERDFSTYRRVFDVIASHLQAPDLIIYLRAPIDILLQRIKRRGRPFEKNISKEYLSTLDIFYERWVRSINFCPVLEITSSNDDFADVTHMSSLIKQIAERASQSHRSPDTTDR